MAYDPQARHIQIKNVNQGGIADSDYLGALNSVAEMVGINIHGEAGIMSLNQRLTRVSDSGSPVDCLCKAIVTASTGDTYFFGTSGKIWKKTGAGVWSLERTASPAAGSAGILAAEEYQGYIYYAMQSRLGRFDLASTWNDNFATFTNTDATYHPMQEVNQVLYIGDKNYVSQVDAGTFSANALDIKTPLRISALGKMNTDLLIGTYVAANVSETEVLRWNTWSDSYSVSDTIPEVGINAFLNTDNRVIVSAGTKGNLYFYNGQQMEEYKQIKGTWSNTNKAIVMANAKANFHGLPLFGLSVQSGSGVNLGVYSFGRTNANYPFVLNLEYPISTGNLNNVTIGAIRCSGDTFFVSWEDTTGGSSAYGVDELDLSNKYASGYLMTRVSQYDRVIKSTYKKIKVPYREIPTGTLVKVYSKRNYGSLTEMTTQTDTDRLVIETNDDAGEATTFQSKIVLEGSGNSSPQIEMIDIEVH